MAASPEPPPVSWMVAYANSTNWIELPPDLQVVLESALETGHHRVMSTWEWVPARPTGESSPTGQTSGGNTTWSSTIYNFDVMEMLVVSQRSGRIRMMRRVAITSRSQYDH